MTNPRIGYLPVVTTDETTYTDPDTGETRQGQTLEEGPLKIDVDNAIAHASSNHAPTDANKNVQPDWNQATTTEDDFIKNKPELLQGEQGEVGPQGPAGENYTPTADTPILKPYADEATATTATSADDTIVGFWL